MKPLFRNLVLILVLLFVSGFVLAQGILETSGQITFLRIHDVGTGFGPPNDMIDGEVIIQLNGKGNFYGFTLRNNDRDSLTHEGMLSLLLSAYENNWNVTINYRSVAGKKNLEFFRVWLRK